MRIRIIAVGLMLVAGCAPSSSQGLKNKHCGKDVFEVHENYQPAYRRILQKTRANYQTGMITAQMMVQGDIYTDTESGNVTVALHGGLGVDTYVTMDIAALSDTSTKVTAYYACVPARRGYTKYVRKLMKSEFDVEAIEDTSDEPKTP